MDEILTAEQVAQLLKVHQYTVLKFIKQGKLKASKLGRVYRIRKSEVDRFLDSQMEPTEQQEPKPEKKRRLEKKEKREPESKQEPEVKAGPGSKRKESSQEDEGKAESNSGKSNTHYILRIKDE